MSTDSSRVRVAQVDGAKNPRCPVLGCSALMCLIPTVTRVIKGSSLLAYHANIPNMMRVYAIAYLEFRTYPYNRCFSPVVSY